MIRTHQVPVAVSEDGEVFYGRPAVSEMSPRDAITRIFLAYGSGKNPEFQIRRTAEGGPLLRMLEFPIFGDAEQVFFTGPMPEMEILTRAADRLATAKSGDRTLVAMMLREGIAISADINRGLELTISGLGLALRSYRYSTELSFGRIVDVLRVGFGKKISKKK